ncbi:MAG: hypothetical protein K2L00_06485 [Muribaculaceae bacterium]|nr:hypothetical protein [Muribaculaceae bacterium]
MHNHTKHLSQLFFGAIALLALVCCQRQSEAWKMMNIAEEVMDSRPDSALSLLNSIQAGSLGGRKEKARYALLKSMALDKNVIDTTEFDVLQPAIDYYLKKGSADERLLTYYYQGRIYQNRGENDSAMYSFLHGREFFPQAKDTLTIANLMVAQATIQYQMYRFDDYIRNNEEAARLYGILGRVDYEVSCLANAMDICVINADRQRADSLLSIINEITSNIPELIECIAPYKLDYLLQYGERKDIMSILNYYASFDSIDDYAKIDIATAYYNLGEFNNAMHLIDSVSINSSARNSMEYLSIRPNILEKNGDFAGALKAYKNFSATIDSIHMDMISRDLLFAQQKHELEKSNLIEIHKRDKRVWIMLFVAFVMMVSAVFLYNCYKLSQTKRLLAEKEKRSLLQVNEKLELEHKNTLLAKEAAESERDRKSLETENLKMRIEQLEKERLHLKEVIEERKDLEKPLQDVLKTRMEMLNTLLAAEISKNAKYTKSYNKWQDELLKDKDEFMKSTRLAFKGLYPKFMEYLESRDLSESEINYLCLYAIGLRGTEVGEYIQIKRHYHISSDIRKKLGIDEHETNIGLYVRKLMKSI